LRCGSICLIFVIVIIVGIYFNANRDLKQENERLNNENIDLRSKKCELDKTCYWNSITSEWYYDKINYTDLNITRERFEGMPHYYKSDITNGLCIKGQHGIIWENPKGCNYWFNYY